MANEQPSRGNRSNLIIVFLVLIIIGQSVKIYWDYRDMQSITETLVEKTDELDNTLQRLNEIKQELNEKIATITKLGGDITELEKAKGEIQKELSRTRTRNAKAVAELKDRLEGYEELLQVKDQEIERLKEVNKELFTENRSLKTKQNVLNDSINRLAKNKQELTEKVSIASRLEAENIQVVALNSRGKERTSPFRAKQLEKLKIEFNIARNDVAPIEGKKIMIRVIDENDQVIFDVSKGSGTFMLNGRETFYTAQQEILFDNTQQKLSFVYEKGSEYAIGTYRVEVFTEGYQMGTFSFEVK
jgi:chromosome segregation ATPase